MRLVPFRNMSRAESARSPRLAQACAALALAAVMTMGFAGAAQAAEGVGGRPGGVRPPTGGPPRVVRPGVGGALTGITGVRDGMRRSVLGSPGGGLLLNDKNSMGGSVVARDIKNEAWFNGEGYHGYPIDSMRVITDYCVTEECGSRGESIRKTKLGAGGWDMVVNGTFFYHMYFS